MLLFSRLFFRRYRPGSANQGPLEKRHPVKQIVLSLALLPLLGMAGQAQVLFTNFGPAMTYDSVSVYAITSGSCGAQSIAAKFQPSTSAFFQDAQLALGLLRGTNHISIFLATDVAGKPGVPIDGPINVSGLVGYPGSSVITAPSTLHPFLMAGTSYWLVAAALHFDTCGGWFGSLADASNGSNFASNTNGSPFGPWSYAPANVLIRTAFQIDGSATINTGALQIHYASNLNQGDSVVNITNTGDSATALLTPGQTGANAQNNINGSICVNIYAFSAHELEVACCACLVTPNALWSASVKTALLNSTLTASFPNEVVIKLLSTIPLTGAGGAQTCNPASPTIASLASGLLAWGTTVHGFPTATGPTFSIAETPFSQAALSGAELARDVQECQFIQVLGSGQFGICKGCQNVGLGAAAQ
jgi:hypothetical protein